jgi:hypothetical protein
MLIIVILSVAINSNMLSVSGEAYSVSDTQKVVKCPIMPSAIFSEYFTPNVTLLSAVHSDVMLSVVIKSNILSVSDECRSSVVMVS